MKRLAVMVLLVACAKGTNPPVINDFQATPASVHLGNKTMLSWDVSGASQISIDQGVGVQQGHSVDVTPGAVGDTTYTLTATGLGGTVTKATTVTVLGAVAKPVIESFTASPNDVPYNGATTLTWKVTGATALSVSDGTNHYDVTGLTARGFTVGSAASYTFTLSASNDGGTVTATALVTTHAPVKHFQYTDPA